MRWTIKEDKLISEALVRNNNDKTMAFQDVADKLGVSRKAVEGRYYRNKENINKFVENLQNLNSYLEQTISIEDIHPIKEKKEPWYIRLWNAVQSMLNLNQRL